MSAAQIRRPWRDLLTTFWPDFRAHRRLVLISYVARAIAVAAALVAPWPLKLIIDHVITGHVPRRFAHLPLTQDPARLVLALTVAFFVVTLIGAFANAAEKNLSATVRERMTFELRDRLLMHLLRLSPNLRTEHRSGELVLRVIDDSDLFVRVLTKTLPQVFQHALTIVATLVMVAWLQPALALAGGLWLPIIALVLRRDGRRLWAASREKRLREGEVCGLTQEIVRGMAVIQASGTERPTQQTFGELNRRRVSAGRHETAVAVSLEQSLQILQGIAMALVTAGGAWLVVTHRLSIGDLTLLTVYVGQLLKPIEKLNDLAETTGRGLAGGERLVRLLQRRPAVTDTPEAVSLTVPSHGVLELDGVSFKYPERSTPVLRNVSVRLVPGELNVLVGPSGTGKSTLLSLLVRLCDPASGVIRLDGTPVTSIRLRSLREQFAVLSQDTHVFAGSIRQALQPAERPIAEQDMWDALARVSMDRFVSQLPEQLDTLLGEDGVNLSGGQRRRVALARAFLLQRPILLLDEPLANIDSESAQVVLDAIDAMRQTCTCLAATHDASLVQRATRILRLQNGQILESSPAAALSLAVTG